MNGCANDNIFKRIGVDGLLMAAVGVVAVIGALALYAPPAPDAAESDTAEPTPDAVAETAAPEASPAPSAALYEQTSVTLDGVYLGTLSSRQAAEQAIDDAEEHFSASLPLDGSVSGGIVNDIVLAADPDAETLLSADQLYAALTGEDTALRVVYTVDVATTHTSPYKTTTVKDSTLLLGVRFYESVGRAGVVHTVERLTYENGVLTGTEEIERITLAEEADEVVRVGTMKVSARAVPAAKGGKKGRDAGDLTFIWPVRGSVSLNFGGSKGIFHYGTDFVTDKNADVVASCAGTVVFARERGGYGLTVEIDHGGGFLTRYAQLTAISVSPGDIVEQGQVIGSLTADGELHFELRIDGRAYNPRLYLN